jgi:hypothetical protein
MSLKYATDKTPPPLKMLIITNAIGACSKKDNVITPLEAPDFKLSRSYPLTDYSAVQIASTNHFLLSKNWFNGLKPALSATSLICSTAYF